jgi:hypothetical protein
MKASEEKHQTEWNRMMEAEGVIISLPAEVTKLNLRLKENRDVMVAEVHKLKEEMKITMETCVEEIHRRDESLERSEEEC